MIRLILAAFLLGAGIVCSFAQVPNQSMGVPNSAPGIQSNLTATSAPTTSNDQTQGYAVGSLWQNASTAQIWICRSNATGAAVWTMIELSDHPGHIVGNWYLPSNINQLSAGSAPGAGSIRLLPAYIKERITINALGLRVTTLSASGNVQAAIYANNPATMRPTGPALVSTASMSTTNVASINAAVSVQLEPGFYWFATNCDNGTAVFTSPTASGPFAGNLIGSTNQTATLGAGGSLVGVSTPQTFGTWPDLTSATFTEVTTNMIPVVTFKIGSVP